MHIYVDESGNLIGPKGQKRIFLVGALRTEDNRAIRKLFEQAKRYTLPKGQRHLTEIDLEKSFVRFGRFVPFVIKIRAFRRSVR